MTLEYRHGDVGLIRVAELPAGAVAQDRLGDLILQQGTSTGHAHRIKAKTAQIFTVGETRYLVTKRPATLAHEEHGPMTIAPLACSTSVAVMTVIRGHPPHSMRA